MSIRKPRAFTIVELLIVVAILATLLSLLLPSVSQAWELSRRTSCAANMHGIGHAMYIYAQNAPHVFPAIAQTFQGAGANLHLFFPQDRTTSPSTTGIPSPTVDMWTLLRRNHALPQQFICPSTTDTPDPAQDTTAYYDFYRMGNLSYGYQYQHDSNRRVIGINSEPTFPVLADANPYIKGEVKGITLLVDRLSQYRGNSANHPMRAGQNVLFQDAHVFFEMGPDVGLSGNVNGNVTVSRGRDHCYTVHGSTTNDPPVDYGLLPPIWADPANAGTLNLGSKSDACLVP